MVLSDADRQKKSQVEATLDNSRTEPTNPIPAETD